MIAKNLKRNILQILLGFLICSFSHAQVFPDKTVKAVVAFGVGGQTDAAARILSQKLSERWNQAVVVENKTGANGNIGTEFVAKSAPDGLTLNIATQTLTINKVVFPSPNFDPLKDLSPIAIIGKSDFVLVVHPSLPVYSVQDLVKYAKANSDKVNYGATSFQGEFIMELFNFNAGIRIERVPYTAMGNLLTDLLAGRTNVFFTPPKSVLAHIQSGKLRPLAVTSSKPLALLPQVKSILIDYPNMQATTWYGVLAPKQTPVEIINKINTDLKWAISQPTVKDQLEQLGIDPETSSPQEMSAILSKDVQMVEDLVKRGVMKVSK